MSDSGLLEFGNTFQMKCLWFCYFKVLQNELDNVKAHWKSHYIRQSRHDTIPGVSDILYYSPENFDGIDCLAPVSLLEIQEVEPNMFQWRWRKMQKKISMTIISPMLWKHKIRTIQQVLKQLLNNFSILTLCNVNNVRYQLQGNDNNYKSYCDRNI